MESKDEEWVLQCVTKSKENCEGYIPTIWEITRWISANEGLICTTIQFYRVKNNSSWIVGKRFVKSIYSND